MGSGFSTRFLLSIPRPNYPRYSKPGIFIITSKKENINGRRFDLTYICIYTHMYIYTHIPLPFLFSSIPLLPSRSPETERVPIRRGDRSGSPLARCNNAEQSKHVTLPRNVN